MYICMCVYSIRVGVPVSYSRQYFWGVGLQHLGCVNTNSIVTATEDSYVAAIVCMGGGISRGSCY